MAWNRLCHSILYTAALLRCTGMEVKRPCDSIVYTAALLRYTGMEAKGREAAGSDRNITLLTMSVSSPIARLNMDVASNIGVVAGWYPQRLDAACWRQNKSTSAAAAALYHSLHEAGEASVHSITCRVVPRLSKNSAVGDSALGGATGVQGHGAQQEGSCRCSIQHLKPPVVLLQPNQVVHPLDRFNTGSRCLAPPRENSCTPANDSRKPHPDGSKPHANTVDVAAPEDGSPCATTNR